MHGDMPVAPALIWACCVVYAAQHTRGVRAREAVVAASYARGEASPSYAAQIPQYWDVAAAEAYPVSCEGHRKEAGGAIQKSLLGCALIAHRYYASGACPILESKLGDPPCSVYI